MKVSAVQLGLYPRNAGRAIDEAELQVKVAAEQGARLVCLPEHWLLSRVLATDGRVIERFGELARDVGIYLNLGANYFTRGGDTFVTSHTMSPEGMVVAQQDKIHLFRNELIRASPGSGLKVFGVDGVKVGVVVCHDLVFPEVARILALKGAELLVVPAMINAAGLEPWATYVKARSLENRVPVISPGVYSPPRFLGGSCIVGLTYLKKGGIMRAVENKAKGEPTVLTADLDVQSIRSARKERLSELLRPGGVGSIYSSLEWTEKEDGCRSM